MSHNKTKVNSIDPDGSGNISITTDNVAETATNEYYTPARIDTKIAATNIDAFADVNTAGAVDGQVLKRSGGIYVAATASGGAEIAMIGNGSTVAYPWTGGILSGNEPYSNGKQIEFYSLNLGTGLTSIKYEVRTAGTSNGTSAWSWVDAPSYAAAGWVRALSFFPAGTYLVTAGVGLGLPATTSYLDCRIFAAGAAHSSISRVGGDTGYPKVVQSIVTFGSAPTVAGDNQIDVRVDASSNDLTGQVNEQSQRGFIYAMRLV